MSGTGDRQRRGKSAGADSRRGGYSGQRSPRSSQGSVVSGGSYTQRPQTSRRAPESLDSTGRPRQRPRSADGSYCSRASSYGSYGGERSPGRMQQNRQQYGMNSPSTTGGRLPNGRLLSGQAPDTMVHHPRCGQSRTQNGGIWEEHKTFDRFAPEQSNTRCGFSEFGDNEPTENSTYQQHFVGGSFAGGDSMGPSKPNTRGISTATRGVNGYGRSATGGFTSREQMGGLPSYKHADAWRGMPAWARKIPEPTRPGPGYTRTDQGGYFRT